MRYALSFLAVFFSLPALSQTIIDYEDGSTYTLEQNEEAYVTHEIVFVKREYASGSVYFRALSPNIKRDYVETPWDGLKPGSHEWCKVYVPWSEGYTFGMQTWQRSCDTNGDGVYDENDDGWSE
jgi:hypothetical protein